MIKTGDRAVTGPRVGSRVWALSQIEPGGRIALIVPKGITPSAFMQQVGTDIGRANLRGVLRQTIAIGVVVSSREVLDLVLVDRA